MNKILIVDDSTFARNIVKNILQKNGYKTLLEACDGNDAVEKYKQEAPSLVILDINMPSKDGMKALEEICNYNEKANVIMCSAMGLDNTIINAIKTGAKDFIVKPFKPEKLLKAVDKILR